MDLFSKLEETKIAVYVKSSCDEDLLIPTKIISFSLGCPFKCNGPNRRNLDGFSEFGIG